jgi:hypothetical protein
MDGRITIEGEVMAQFCEGGREAGYLIDREPGRVGLHLERAQRDRRRWKTRLFHRERARFLDGYIARLVAHEAGLERADVTELVPGMVGDLRESDVVQAIAALNRSGWSIGEAALVGELGHVVRVVSNPDGEGRSDAGGPAEAGPVAGE